MGLQSKQYARLSKEVKYNLLVAPLIPLKASLSWSILAQMSDPGPSWPSCFRLRFFAKIHLPERSKLEL